jgi:hypothetical protein
MATHLHSNRPPSIRPDEPVTAVTVGVWDPPTRLFHWLLLWR